VKDLSRVARRLGKRRVPVAARVPRTLDSVAIGEAGVTVSGFRADVAPEIGRRLGDLGFVVGAPVTVVRRAPFSGPVIVDIAGYEIALRVGEARRIVVSEAR